MKRNHLRVFQWGIFLLTFVFALGVAHATHDHDDGGILDKIHDKHGDGDGDGDGDGEKCCACIPQPETEDPEDQCCLLVDADKCDEEGFLKEPTVIIDFAEALDINVGQICSFCDACGRVGLSDEEQDGFLDVCLLCIFGDFISKHECTPVQPTPVLPELFAFGGGCQLTNHPSRIGGGLWGRVAITLDLMKRINK